MKKCYLSLFATLLGSSFCLAEQAKSIDISLGEIIAIAIAAIAAYVLGIYIIAFMVFTLLNRSAQKARKGIANTFTGALIFSVASAIGSSLILMLIATLLGATLGYFMTPVKKDETPNEL
jgi:hypothetical protein